MAETKELLSSSPDPGSGGSQIRELPPELQEILAAHQQWLKTWGKEGNRVDLDGFDFQGLDLSGADLRQAILKNARFQGAVLVDAQLQEANLQGSNFQGANLLRTRLQGAELQDADLAAADNLLAPQLAGADLTDARLPEALRRFEDLGNIAEASRISSHVFLVMLAACVYAWLTVATTTDAALLTNTATSTLPVIATAIPLVGFYVAAPLLLLAIYLYFHLNLTRLWEGLAALPAVFPDGRRLDQVAYPWFLNGLVCAYFPRLQSRRPPFSRLQVILSLILAWGVVPLTLVLLWGRFLPRHDWGVTALHLLLLVLVAWFGLRANLLARVLLRGKGSRGGKQSLLEVAATLAYILFFFLVSFFVSFGAIEADPVSQSSLFPANISEADVSLKPPNWTGKSHEEIAFVKGAKLKGRNLRCARAYRAFLVHADLSLANLRGADLKQADLYEADLQGADLSGADLSGADLQGAILASYPTATSTVGFTLLFNAVLKGANLKAADLKSVVLNKANLNQADLFEANLEHAVLEDADLFKANFRKANLWGASFTGASLKWADLRETKGIHAEKLKMARDWPLALYDPEMLQALNLPPDHNDRVKAKNLSRYNLRGQDLKRFFAMEFDLQGTDLQGANLQEAYLWGINLQGANLQVANLQKANISGANLRGANLRGANLQKAIISDSNLQGANLMGANLREANLNGADLRGSQGLSREQLASAITDNTTKLPEDLQKPAAKPEAK